MLAADRIVVQAIELHVCPLHGLPCMIGESLVHRMSPSCSQIGESRPQTHSRMRILVSSTIHNLPASGSCPIVGSNRCTADNTRSLSSRDSRKTMMPGQTAGG